MTSIAEHVDNEEATPHPTPLEAPQEQVDDLYGERPPSPYPESNVEASEVAEEDAGTPAQPPVDVEDGAVTEGPEEDGDDEQSESGISSPPPSESFCYDYPTPRPSPRVQAKEADTPQLAQKSLPKTPSEPSKDTFFKGSKLKEDSLVKPVVPSWQQVNLHLMDSVAAMPFSMIRKSMEDYNASGDLDETALSIWTMQTYKRFLRALDPQFAANPKRLFVPPNAAQAIESALLNGYRTSACDLLKKLWNLVNVNPANAPEHVVVMIQKKGHWVLHW